jgi:hypothetical protein
MVQQIRGFVGVNILTMVVTALVAVSLNNWLFPIIGFLSAREGRRTRHWHWGGCIG